MATTIETGQSQRLKLGSDFTMQLISKKNTGAMLRVFIRDAMSETQDSYSSSDEVCSM